MPVPSPALAVLVALSSVALALSIALLRRSMSAEALPGCGAGSGCDAVLATRWSRWAGRYPVAGLSVVAYLLIIALAVLAAWPTAASARPATLLALTTLCLAVGGAAGWFIALQGLVIRRWCPYCVATHILGIGVAATAVIAVPIRLGVTASRMSPLFTAAVGVTVLIVGQLIARPKGYAVGRSESGVPTDHQSTSRNTPAPPIDEAGASHGAGVRPPRLPGRPIQLLAGRLVLRTDEWPMLGSPGARHVIACFFDYTCASCWRVHRLLTASVEHYRPQLAILMIPVPQDPKCNPSIAQVGPDGQHACEFAKLGLRVWAADPAAYERYERWMFEGTTLPGLDSAAEHADRLINRGIRDSSAIEVTVDNMLSRAVAAHASTRASKVPLLLLPRAIVSGEVPTSAELHKILAKELDLTTIGIGRRL